MQGLEGQLTTYKAHLGPPHPCYRCLFPKEPPPGLIPTCAEGGVLGPAAGVLGCLQAVEVVKEIIGIGDSLSGTLVLYDALSHRAAAGALRPPRRLRCALCGGAGHG